MNKFYPNINSWNTMKFCFHHPKSSKIKNKTLQGVFSRPGQSQELVYKHLHAQTVRGSSFSYKTDYVIVIKNFLSPEGHQHCISGSKVMFILLKGCIFPYAGVASGRVCACSLPSRLVFFNVGPKRWIWLKIGFSNLYSTLIWNARLVQKVAFFLLTLTIYSV